MKLLFALRRPFLFYRQQTGQSLGLWLVIALAAFAVQIIFRRHLIPGHFGTLQTSIAVAGLFSVPLIALSQTFAQYFAHHHPPERRELIETLEASRMLIIDIAAGLLAILALPGFFIILPAFALNGFTLVMCIIFLFIVSLGTIVSAEIYRANARTWSFYLLIAAAARIILALGLAHFATAYTAFIVLILASIITVLPALGKDHLFPKDLAKAWTAVRDRDFLLNFGATFSVVLGVFLFTNADRIVSQDWFGHPVNTNVVYVNWPRFDAYQTAGLLARGLLWGTLPILLLVYVDRSRVNRTTLSSMRFVWLYLVALISGVILLGLLHNPLSELFCGADFEQTANYVPAFAFAMVPLGLLQFVGIFALASRKFPECFTFGAVSLAYSLPLYLAGRQPEVMLLYMFGGAVVSLMLILFVGVVRWGRRQP